MDDKSDTNDKNIADYISDDDEKEKAGELEHQMEIEIDYFLAECREQSDRERTSQQAKVDMPTLFSRFPNCNNLSGLKPKYFIFAVTEEEKCLLTSWAKAHGVGFILQQDKNTYRVCIASLDLYEQKWRE